MYVKASVLKKLLNVHSCTLVRWANEGKLEYVWSPGGIRLYKLPKDVEPTVADGSGRGDCGGGAHHKEKIAYARVSSAKQKDDLQRQVDYLSSKFPDHRVVTDVGSGINWKRKGLLSVLDAADRGGVEEVVVASRDRLCRFAFELVEHVLRQRSVRLVVLDGDADSSPEQELSDDLLSIVQIFCCRRNGKRRYAAREGTGNDGNNGKRLRGDADASTSTPDDNGVAADA